MSDKLRADLAIVKRGLCPSREKAQAFIMAGLVYIGERKIVKASELVKDDDILLIRSTSLEYVSRGALKLEKAIRVFKANMDGCIVMDIGASTGGFTDVSLHNGAKHVYAIDVGYGQLDWKLRNDPRVTVMERTNARYLTADMFPEKPQITVMDVSFISICLIIPCAAGIMGDDGIFYTLIKPQFEAGRDKVGKKGVVRDPLVHRNVLLHISEYTQSIGWEITGIDYSPITGPEGNIEFLARIQKHHGNGVSESEIISVVEHAHQELGER